MEAAATYSVAKRFFDTTLSLAGLIVGAPIVLVAIAAVKLDSPGPALFRQVRIGRNGVPFICLKLRSMRVDTGDRPTHETSRSSVTRTGHFLRRSKIDELPQLWNVLKGEMSLVGPRPCLPTQVELIQARKELGVLGMRPGITGVSQIAGVDMSDPRRLASLDATYRPSFVNDIRILLATVSGSGRGDRVSL